MRHHLYYEGIIHKNSGSEIPETWMPAIKNTSLGKQYNNGLLRDQLFAGTMEHWENTNEPITVNLCNIHVNGAV